jgi:hypothetical protein
VSVTGTEIKITHFFQLIEILALSNLLIINIILSVGKRTWFSKIVVNYNWILSEDIVDIMLRTEPNNFVTIRANIILLCNEIQSKSRY